MIPLVHLKRWCLCGGHLHVADAPSLVARQLAYWEKAHVGLGHAPCRASEAKGAQKVRRSTRTKVEDDFHQAMNDLRPEGHDPWR